MSDTLTDPRIDPNQRDTTPAPGVVTGDVNAILGGMTDASMDRILARRAPLPPSLQPSYQPNLPPQLQQSPAPWAPQPQFAPPPQDQTQQPPAQQPRPYEVAGAGVSGVRDPTGRNNPGNIRSGPNGTFGSYPTMQAGIDAIGRQLITYQDRDHINTIGGMIGKYAPPWDPVAGKANDTRRYIQTVADKLGIDPNQPIDIHDPKTRQAMVDAIIGVEQGGVGSQRNFVDSMSPPEPRGSEDWGHPPPMMVGGLGGQGGFGQAGNLPRPSQFGQVLNTFAPLLVGIASLALRLPLSTAITAYGAMARAQQNGQNQDYERQRTRFRDQLAEANAQQTLESQAASDAFSEYGHNNPQGLQQRLAQIALQYNDPTMLRMAERGDLNGIHQLQQRRDLYNQGLTKLNRAVQDEQDQQAVNADVAARDRQYQREHPDATPDELAIAHAQHLGQAQQDFSGKGQGAGQGEEAAIRDVVGPDGKPTGQQVREGKGGGYYDPDTGQQVHLKPGERTEVPAREGAGSGMEAPIYNVVGANGQPTGKQVRIGKNGGLFTLDGQPTTKGDNETLQPLTRGSETPQAATDIPETWEGAPDKPPPGADPAAWALALQWAQTGKTPTGLGRQTGMLAQVERLLPAAQHALGVTPSRSYEQQLKLAGEVAAERYWTAGQGQRQLQYLNTTASHLNLFRQYAEALHNGEVQRANQLVNLFARETGHPEVTDYNTARVLMADEVVRLLTQTGGSRGDRDDAQHLADTNYSPEQLTGVADTLQNFVRGRFEAMQTSFVHIPYADQHDIERRTTEFQGMMTPEAREVFETGQRPVPGADVPPMTEEQYNAAPSGTRYRMPNDAPGTVRIKP